MSGRWKLWVPLGGFLLLLALFIIGLNWPEDRNIASQMVGKPLPAFDLPAAVADRPALSNANLADGKPKLLNVFASWCVPCIAEAPYLERLRRMGAEIHGVAIRDTTPDVTAFLARNGNPYARIGADDLSVVQLGIGSSGVPETFVIDGKGIIRYQHIGDIRESDVPLLLEELRKAKQ